MASRLKELVVCVIDVSPSMASYRTALSATLFTFVHSQILFKPNNEVALLLFGTDVTDNAIHEEMKKRRKHGQYTNVTELMPLDVPDLNYLTAIGEIKTEEGSVDYLNALTVGVDCLKRRLATKSDPAKYLRRIMMFSDFTQRVKSAKPEFALAMDNALQEVQIRVEAFVLDLQPKQEKPEALDVKEMLGVEKASFSVRRIRSEMELYSLFPAKPVSSTAMYRGPIKVGDQLQISVKVFKKTSRERLPSPGAYSTRQEFFSFSQKPVVRDLEHKKVSDPSEPILPEFHARSYIYGVQFVPLSAEDEKAWEYVPVKGIYLKGFLSLEQVPRHHYMKDTFLLLPETDETSQVKLSALAQACAEQEKAAIVQCALRKGSSVFLGILTPHIDRNVHPDAFLMNVCPFMEDLRDFPFPSFSAREHLLPSDEQLELLAKIEQKEARMEIDEEVITDKAVNPRLRRFHSFLGKRSLKDLEKDALGEMVFRADHVSCGKGLQETLDTYVRISKRQKTDEETAHSTSLGDDVV